MTDSTEVKTARRIFHFWKREMRLKLPKADFSEEKIWMGFWAGYRAGLSTSNELLVAPEEQPEFIQAYLESDPTKAPSRMENPTRAAKRADRSATKATVAEVLHLRLLYEVDHSLAQAWLDAENTLTESEFLEYMNLWRHERRRMNMLVGSNEGYKMPESMAEARAQMQVFLAEEQGVGIGDLGQLKRRMTQ